MRQSTLGKCPSCHGVRIGEFLWLCPHRAWGFTSNLIGAEEEARRLLERAGGYDAVLALQVKPKKKARKTRTAA